MVVMRSTRLLGKTHSSWSHAVQVVPEWDFPVASLAHLTGALAGLLCAVLVDVLRPDSQP